MTKDERLTRIKNYYNTTRNFFGKNVLKSCIILCDELLTENYVLRSECEFWRKVVDKIARLYK